MTTPLRVAVIGGGAFGREHVAVYRELPAVTLVAIVEPNPELHHQWLIDSARGDTQIFHTVAEMLSATQLDAASLVVPGRAHRKVASELLSAGVDILVEKPFADTVVNAKGIAEQAALLGRICLPGYLLRFSPNHLALKQRAASGEFGEILGVFLRRDRSKTLTIRYPDIHPALLTGVHDIDLAIWLTGQSVVEVSAIEHSDSTARVDIFIAQMRHEHGAVSTVSGAYLLSEFDSDGVDDQVNLYGSLGIDTLHLSRAELGVGVANAALVAELRHFINCVRDQRPSELCSPENAVHVVDIAEAIILSASIGGATVAVSAPQQTSPNARAGDPSNTTQGSTE